MPEKYPEGRWHVNQVNVGEEQIVPKIADCQFTTADDLKLHGWYCTPHRKTDGALVPVPAEMVLLYFHGNAGNITHRSEMILQLSRLPIDVFIIDYRGYGQSQGSPSEEGLYVDARATWDYLTTQLGIRSEQIVLFGKSLGGAIAIDLATKVKPAGLIVQSSFTSMADMAAAAYQFVQRFLVRTKMDSIKKIVSVGCPKLFIHSPVDDAIPYEQGRRLFDAAPAPKQFYEVAGASHNETDRVGGAAYFNVLGSFVRSLRPGSPPAPVSD